MKTRKIVIGLSLALSTAIAGCGVSTPPSATLSPGATATTVAAESVPSQAQLQRLVDSSPEKLVKNAPSEPGATGLWPTPPKEDLGNFGKMESTLWRGARPTDKGLEKLASMGVKTIVNLENSEEAVEHERAWALAHGLKFVSIPLSVVTPPKLEKIKSFMALAEDPANRPLYFHCMQGRDRTGTAAFSYRVSHDGWGYKQAYTEMQSYHFHTYLLGLRAFLVWFAETQGHQIK